MRLCNEEKMNIKTILFTIFVLFFIFASSKKEACACGYEGYEILGTSQDNDIIVSCSWLVHPRKLCPFQHCIVYSLTNSIQLKKIVLHKSWTIPNKCIEIEVKGSVAFYDNSLYRNKVYKEAESYLKREYPEKNIKIGWWGKESLVSPDGQYEVQLSGDFFTVVNISDKKHKIKYPIYASEPGVHSYPGQCFASSDNDVSPLCIRKLLWNSDKATIVISNMYHGVAPRDYLYIINLKDMTPDSLDKIQHIFLSLARNGIYKKGDDNTGTWILPWEMKCNCECKDKYIRSLVLKSGWVTSDLESLVHFNLAHQIKQLLPNDYFLMIRKSLSVKSFFNLPWNHKMKNKMADRMDSYINNLIQNIDNQLPEKEAIMTANKLTAKKLKKKLKKFEAYISLKERLKEIEN